MVIDSIIIILEQTIIKEYIIKVIFIIKHVELLFIMVQKEVTIIEISYFILIN